jgi:hypothetical protein
MPSKVPGHGQTYSNGNQQWHVPRLIELVATMPVVELPVRSFREWDHDPWGGHRPSLAAFTDHMKRVLSADLTKPIIVSAEGWIMDGCHRLVRAKLDGCDVIKAVRFTVTPEPCVPDMDGACWAEMEEAAKKIDEDEFQW